MYDAVIVGGGPSGVTCAARIAQLRGKVAIVERSFLGGVCSNWGCIPTKAMIASARFVYESARSESLGVKSKVQVDFSKVVKHRDRQIANSRKMMADVLSGFGVELIKGEGKLLDRNTVKVGNRILRAKNIVVATGSKATIPPTMQLSDKVLSSKEMVRINHLPKRLVVIGGGVIGVEFATIFSLLGSKVTIVERFDRLVFNEDEDVSILLQDEFKRQGMTVYLGASVTKIDKRFVHAGNSRIPYDTVLVATGRLPLLDEKTLTGLNVDFDKYGIKTNTKMQSSVSGIYAIGDSTGKSILAHVGTRQAVVAANNIMGRKDSISYVIPRCVYSIPEIACVGKTEKEALGSKSCIFHLKDNAKAMLENHAIGFIKVIFERDRIVGFQMIGHNVTELVGEATLIVQHKIPARKICDTIHAHPTLGESLKFAIQKAVGELVDVP
jgi:dihydrolipoamide dehydrogenase